MAGIIEDLDSQSFEAGVIGATGLVVVDFWAPWCGPCKMVGPVLEKLAGDNDGKVKVTKVNVDENQELASGFGVRSIPTLLVLKKGVVQEQMVGAMNKNALMDKLKAYL